MQFFLLLFSNMLSSRVLQLRDWASSNSQEECRLLLQYQPGRGDGLEKQMKDFLYTKSMNIYISISIYIYIYIDR
jgi:hypothetical protein